MILADFDYIKPKTLKEASDVLLEYKNSRILGGGTDLFVKMRDGKIRPEKVVDIKDIEELNKIEWQEGFLKLGSAVTWTQIKEDEKIKKHFPALHQASSHFGCYEIRNRATIGGNLANAAPGSEGGGPCVVYEAITVIYGPGGFREVPINEFYVGPGRTSMKDGEFLAAVKLPIYRENVKSAYRRAARVKGQDLATCAITLMVINPDDIKSREVRTGLSAVARTPSRAPELEEMLSKKEITRETLKTAKTWLKANLYPRASSLRGSPDYKKKVLGGFLEEMLDEFGMIVES